MWEPSKPQNPHANTHGNFPARYTVQLVLGFCLFVLGVFIQKHQQFTTYKLKQHTRQPATPARLAMIPTRTSNNQNTIYTTRNTKSYYGNSPACGPATLALERAMTTERRVEMSDLSSSSEASVLDFPSVSWIRVSSNKRDAPSDDDNDSTQRVAHCLREALAIAEHFPFHHEPSTTTLPLQQNRPLKRQRLDNEGGMVRCSAFPSKLFSLASPFVVDNNNCTRSSTQDENSLLHKTKPTTTTASPSSSLKSPKPTSSHTTTKSSSLRNESTSLTIASALFPMARSSMSSLPRLGLDFDTKLHLSHSHHGHHQSFFVRKTPQRTGSKLNCTVSPLA